MLVGSLFMMVVLAVAVSGPPTASGQATRTWVSGIGDDANPCSRTAPCKTFPGAISKTAAGGEINCLDPGGFGGVTITKSIIIDCEWTGGGVLTAGAGVSAIVINILPTDRVTLRGLNIHGAGSAQNGIRMVSGGALHVEKVEIRGFRATGGLGMSLQPNAAAAIDIHDTSVTDNGTPTTGGGILIKPTGAAGSARVTLDNVDTSNNFFGVRADTNGNSSAIGIDVAIIGCVATNNLNHGFAAVAVDAPIDMMIDSSTASWNAASGIVASGATSMIRVGRSTITGNNTGTNRLSGGVIESYQTNHIRGNNADGGRTNIAQE